MDMVDFIIIFYSIMAAATMGILYYGFRQIEQVEDAAEKSAEELQAVRTPNRTGSNKTGTI